MVLRDFRPLSVWQVVSKPPRQGVILKMRQTIRLGTAIAILMLPLTIGLAQTTAFGATTARAKVEAPAKDYFAMAAMVYPVGKKYGLQVYEYKSPSRSTAEGVAYNECLRGVIAHGKHYHAGNCSGVWVHYGWLTIAINWSNETAWGTGWGHTLQQAKDNAVRTCEGRGQGTCIGYDGQNSGGIPVNGANVHTTGGGWQT